MAISSVVTRRNGCLSVRSLILLHRFTDDASSSAVTSDDTSNRIFTKQPATLDYTNPAGLRIPSATSRLQSCDLILKAAFPSHRQSEVYRRTVRLSRSILQRDYVRSDKVNTCSNFTPSFISLVISILLMLVQFLVSS